MSTHFLGDGNIGSKPEYRVFPNGNDEPRKLLRLNVRFDNPIPVKSGGYEDRGGFWAPVEIWHADAEHWSELYQRGMRVLVEGRLICQEWKDHEGSERVTFKVEARRIGILPQRIAHIALEEKQDGESNQDMDAIEMEGLSDKSDDLPAGEGKNKGKKR